MKSIEFYKTPYGKIMCQPVGEAAREVTESDREMIQEMLQLISERYPKAFEALSCLYSKSQRNRAYFEYQIVSRFIRCNFGEYDAPRGGYMPVPCIGGNRSGREFCGHGV